MSVMHVWLLLWCLLVPSVLRAEPCRLRWYPVERYVSGGPVVGPVQYRLWLQGLGDAAPQEVGLTNGTEVQIPHCQPGEYLLTAVQESPQVEESPWSEALTVRQLTAPQFVPRSGGTDPCRLRWTASTTYTDMTSVSGKVKYRLWYQGEVDEVPQVLTTTDALSLQVRRCKAGDYFVTADQPQPRVQESVLSAPLVLGPPSPKR